MNIELTKDQYQTLLMMMYCGEWVLNSSKTKEDRISQETGKLEQYLFSFAKDSGFEKFIEFDIELNQYFPTAEMEDEFHKFIDKYNQHQRK